MQWHQDRGTLESCRVGDAHKLAVGCLELLAATLAVKTFLKSQRGVSVKLQLVNQL